MEFDKKIITENKLWFFSVFLLALSVVNYKISEVSPMKEILILSAVIFLIVVAVFKFIK